MTPSERIEARTKELYEYYMLRSWSDCPTKHDWRRVARLTYRYERDAVIDEIRANGCVGGDTNTCDCAFCCIVRHRVQNIMEQYAELVPASTNSTNL